MGRAKARLQDCSTVKDAMAAATAGLRTAVTSMHDATEGGVLGALSELSSACGLPVIVETEKVRVSEEASLVCEAFGLDPLTTLSEGSLIVTCRPRAVAQVLEALAEARVESSEVGRIGGRREGGLWVARRGSEPRRAEPGPDGYWEAYSRALRQGWS